MVDYTLRELNLSWRNLTEKKIYHYHFQVWPDHGTPVNPGGVLNFLQDVNARQNEIRKLGINPVSKCSKLKDSVFDVPNSINYYIFSLAVFLFQNKGILYYSFLYFKKEKKTD